MFDAVTSGQQALNVPDEHKLSRTRLLVFLMATAKAQNSGVFTTHQLLQALAVCVEKTITVLEAEVGTPDEAGMQRVTALALRMADVAARCE